MNSNDIPKKPCPHCNGTGQVIDDVALGKMMRNLREFYGVNMREVADTLHYNRHTIYQLERGELRWTSQKLQGYLAVVQP